MLLYFILGVFKDYQLTALSDFDDANTGYYSVNYRNAAHRPTNQVGVLLCFKSTYRVQLFFPIENNWVIVRMKDAGSSPWTSWMKITVEAMS